MDRCFYILHLKSRNIDIVMNHVLTCMHVNNHGLACKSCIKAKLTCKFNPIHLDNREMWVADRAATVNLPAELGRLVVLGDRTFVCEFRFSLANDRLGLVRILHIFMSCHVVSENNRGTQFCQCHLNDKPHCWRPESLFFLLLWVQISPMSRVGFCWWYIMIYL